MVLRELRVDLEMAQMRDPKTKRPLPGPAYASTAGPSRSPRNPEQEGLDMVELPQTAGTMGPARPSTFEPITTGAGARR